MVKKFLFLVAAVALILLAIVGLIRLFAYQSLVQDEQNIEVIKKDAVFLDGELIKLRNSGKVSVDKHAIYLGKAAVFWTSILSAEKKLYECKDKKTFAEKKRCIYELTEKVDALIDEDKDLANYFRGEGIGVK